LPHSLQVQFTSDPTCIELESAEVSLPLSALIHAVLQVVKDQTGKLDQLTERRIPVVWFGIAQEVRLMGDFDNWTQGFSLSAEEFSDGTFTRFQGDIKLVPVRPSINQSINLHFVSLELIRRVNRQ